ncbi:MAG TPA: hypothetical protein VGB79_14340 [Allosphingosinicella sp.]
MAQSREARECSDDRGVDRCAAEQHRSVLELYGMEPIQSAVGPGRQVRRVFYVDGYGTDLLSISFERRPERDPEAIVRFPRAQGAEPRPAMTAQVPEAVWREVVGASRNFERELVAPPVNNLEICLHSWVFTVEAADPPRGQAPGEARRKVADACGDGLAERFAQLVYQRTLPLFPHCAALDPERYRNGATQLVACQALRGDRLAAAGAMNAAHVLTGNPQPDETAPLRRAFAWQGTLDWAGERSGGDRGEAGAAWVARMTGAARTNFSVRAAHGLTAERVRMEGRLVRTSPGTGDAASTYEVAPVELIWVFGGTQEWEIERAVVGPFARPAPVAPGRR